MLNLNDMKQFDPIEKNKRMSAVASKLFTQLKAKGINTSETDSVEGMNNLLFTNQDGKEFRISHHSFYRYSGLGWLTKDNTDKPNETLIVEVTDDQWLQNYIKPIVLVAFDLNLK